MTSLARSICSLGAGQTISPSSSRLDGVRWYSGISIFCLFVLGDEAGFVAFRFAGLAMVEDDWGVDL